MFKFFTVILLFIFTLICSCSSAITTQQVNLDKKQIIQNIAASVACWNSANLKCFMNYYINSPDTLFISNTKFIYGWQSLYDHYSQKYGSNTNSMGKLSLTPESVKIFDNNHAFLYGRWHLVTESQVYDGVTSLIFEKINKDWKITIDHSNSK